ncbi:CaiF/GrlA family transcriptional regulator, partial [Enterobacter cloacae]|nr:CaiF/GrlA family transcriptional regulator [Enterobacter cloacae]
MKAQHMKTQQNSTTTPGGTVPDDAGCLPGRLSGLPASPDPMAATSPALPAGRVLPLYIRVAQWVMSLGRPVSRDEIAGYFGITARRGGDIMLYIDNAGARLIESERFLITGAHGREVALMRVTMVWPELYTPSRAGRPRG